MRNIDRHLRKALTDLVTCADDFWKGFNFLVHEKSQVVDRMKLLFLHRENPKYQQLLLEGTLLLNKLRERAATWAVGKQLEPEVKEFILKFPLKESRTNEKWSPEALKRFTKNGWFLYPNKPSLIAKCIGSFTITGTSNSCLLIIDVDHV